MKKSILIIYLLLYSFNAFSYDDNIDNTVHGHAATFIVKFSNLILNKNGLNKQGNICVYGYDQTSLLLQEQHKAKITLLSKNLNNCKILYVSKNIDRYDEIINFADRHKIVTIGFDDNFLDNGGILLMQIGRRNFELLLNKNKSKLYEVKFDPTVSSLLIN